MNDLADLPPREITDVSADLMAPAVDAVLARTEVEHLIAIRRDTPEWQMIDEFERLAAMLPQQMCPLKWIFTPGLALRVLRVPAGTKLTSRIHMAEHPFVVTEGEIRVWALEHGWTTMKAPHLGVTPPGTRRVLEAITDTTWITFHVTNETDPEKIEASIFYDHMKLGHMDDIPPENLAALRINQKGGNP